MFDFNFTERDINLIIIMVSFGIMVCSMIVFLGYQERKARRGK